MNSKSNLLLLSLGYNLVSGGRDATLSTPQLPEGAGFLHKFEVEDFELKERIELASTTTLEQPAFYCKLSAPSAGQTPKNLPSKTLKRNG